MARIAGVDLPREKRIEIALTYIYGIGRNIADDIIEATGINPDTGEVIPTDGRNRKVKAKPAEEPVDYEKLYKKLLRKSESQEALIASLKKQLEALKKD